MFCIFQVCAANFGEFCSIVGQEATEKLLVRVAYTVIVLSISALEESLCEGGERRVE